MSTPIVNALSIDVEDYFQVSAFERIIPRHAWEAWPSRVEPSTHRLLDLFAERGIHVSFFTLGWVAERFPALIRRMVDDGHELACHGYEHIRVHHQTRPEFREDLTRSKGILEDLGGIKVTGYRAASFSINESNEWAFEEIESAGFEYSSSIYPVKHDLYGMPDAPRHPFRPRNVAALVEIPVSTARILNRNIPAGGGGYFRLFPYRVSRSLVHRINAHDRLQANMYFHPWEFDPEQPRPPGLSPKTRFRHYLNQRRSYARLARLLTDFRWGPFREVYAHEIAASRATRAVS